jgi:hypothetical protein
VYSSLLALHSSAPSFASEGVVWLSRYDVFLSPQFNIGQHSMTSAFCIAASEHRKRYQTVSTHLSDLFHITAIRSCTGDTVCRMPQREDSAIVKRTLINEQAR